ncbi:MAG: hypothetical protein OXD54_14650 [Candidatus Poribacteria bacterium]|nr:hypothetical protein [Candidatus Poribacteria bacterium]
MATFYKGAGVGTHWHANDSRKTGFSARAPETTPTTETLIDHISKSTANSPYISLTRSYAVAWHYAVFSSKREPTTDIPAYIYEIEIDDSLPHGLNLFDPVKEVVHILPQPLKGIVDLEYMENLLNSQTPQPSNQESGLSSQVELQLIALTFAQRDAEMLVRGYIPPFCIKHRFEVEFSLLDLPQS